MRRFALLLIIAFLIAVTSPIRAQTIEPRIAPRDTSFEGRLCFITAAMAVGEVQPALDLAKELVTDDYAQNAESAFYEYVASWDDRDKYEPILYEWVDGKMETNDNQDFPGTFPVWADAIYAFVSADAGEWKDLWAGSTYIYYGESGLTPSYFWFPEEGLSVVGPGIPYQSVPCLRATKEGQ